MPYSSINDLPSSVRNNLPKHAQEIYLKTFNSAFDSTCKGRDDRDSCAASIAWAAVKNSYEKGADGEWKQKESKENGNVTTNYEVFDETIPGELKRDSISKSGIARIRIIKPGWGSSGYYSEDMLKRDAPKVYTPGLHMYLNHPTTKEEKERPERDLRDLAGAIAGNVAYEDGPMGPGVYADALIFKDKREFLGEIAPFIGISHRVMGKSSIGEAEGKKGPIVESLDKGISVDYVTMPGAGGGIVQLYESWRESGEIQELNSEQAKKDDNMEITVEAVRKNEAVMKELRESILAEQEAVGGGGGKAEELMAQIEEYKKKIAALQAELDRMKESVAIRDATLIVGRMLEKTKLPDVTKARLMESLPSKVVMKEGKLDEEAFGKVVEESVKVETEYITKLSEVGKVRGFGGKPADDKKGKEILRESFKSAYLAQGLPLEEAERRAIIAAEGR